MKQSKNGVKVIKRYTNIRIKEDTTFKRDYIENKFRYSNSELFDKEGNFTCKFYTNNIEKLVNEIMNKGGWNLISVSEDDKSLCYHFIKEEIQK